MTYDPRPYQVYTVYRENRERLIELEIKRLEYERGDRTHEQWIAYLQGKARLDELERRRQAAI